MPMPEVKQQVTAYMVNDYCDDCKKGYMINSGKRREAAVKRGTFYNIHKCSNCGKVKEFDNKQYPYQQYEVIPLNNVNVYDKRDKK